MNHLVNHTKELNPFCIGQKTWMIDKKNDTKSGSRLSSSLVLRSVLKRCSLYVICFTSLRDMSISQSHNIFFPIGCVIILQPNYYKSCLIIYKFQIKGSTYQKYQYQDPQPNWWDFQLIQNIFTNKTPLMHKNFVNYSLDSCKQTNNN